MQGLWSRLRPSRRALTWSGALLIGAMGSFALLYSSFFGPASPDTRPQEFIVAPSSSVRAVAASLREAGLVRSSLAARLALSAALDGRPVRPGAYTLRPSLDTLRVAETLAQPPYAVFITLPDRIRKEQIEEILARELGWGPQERAAWIAATERDPAFEEGVYFPDTYLIPIDQDPAQIAARMRGRFLEVYSPYAARAQEKGLSLKEVLTLASIIDREAAVTDRRLVSGILWNRLRTGMRLQADATLQYIRGAPGAWWPVPVSEDKFLESPFNTYRQAGLPPHPINNPTIESIEAALTPEETPCLFYLHTDRGQIHCSATYAGHKVNIDRYLR